MKRFGFLMMFISLSTLVGCSSDAGEGGIDVSTITITTKPPTFDPNTLTITTGGKLSSDFEGSEEYYVGVCYSNTPNPTIGNAQIVSGGAKNNLEFFSIINSITFGQTFYFKAFLVNDLTGDVKYGNEVSMAIPLTLTTDIVKNISCSGFTVDVEVAANLSGNEARGVCMSTSQNPTISNEDFADSTFGAGPFTVSVQNFSAGYFITPGVTYYLRSYVRIQGVYYYGNQVSFKAAGYIGGSGGYVFFDKGETTNGWRYLEAASSFLVDNNNNQNPYFKWNNCNSTTFLAGLSNEIGTGAENSTIIKADCNFTNNAAAMAKYISTNGKNDWFLPSIEELKMLYTLKKENVISYGSSSYPLISSSQQSNNTNFGFNFSTGEQASMAKNESSRVWQVRRF